MIQEKNTMSNIAACDWRNRWLQESEIVTTTASNKTDKEARCGNVRDRKEKDVVLTGDEKVRYQEKKRTRKKEKTRTKSGETEMMGKKGGILGWRCDYTRRRRKVLNCDRFLARDVRGLTEFRERRRREKRRDKMRKTGERRDEEIKTKIFVVCGKGEQCSRAE